MLVILYTASTLYTPCAAVKDLMRRFDHSRSSADRRHLHAVRVVSLRGARWTCWP